MSAGDGARVHDAAQTRQQVAQTRQQVAQTRQQIAQTRQQIAQTRQQVAQTRQQVASRFGIGAGTLIYYEKLGLVSPPRRSAAGYRLYGEPEIARLALIAKAKTLGLSLREIARLLDGIDSGAAADQLRAGIEKKLEDIRRKIERLEAEKAALEDLAANPRLGECDAIRTVAKANSAVESA